MQHPFKLLFLFSFAISSCVTNNQKRETKLETQISSIDTTQQVNLNQNKFETKELQSDRDTLTIDSKSAVFFQPDILQIEKRMKEAGGEDFRAGADDYIYYRNTAAEYVEKQGLPVIDAKGTKYLKF